jgi:dolichol-phosphate mannosyltransferase
MSKMVDKRIKSEVGDFRLLSRAAVRAIQSFREQHRFLRGLIAWLGLKEVLVPFHRGARAAGETKFALLAMVRFAWTAVVSFSALPLRICMAVGTLVSLASFSYLVYALYAALIVGNVGPGWTSLVVLQCFLFGLTLCSLGLIADYIGRIYDEAKRRPLYVVARVVNFDNRVSSRPRSVVLPPVEWAHDDGRDARVRPVR